MIKDGAYAMIQVNEHFLKLQSSYLFSEISQRVSLFSKKNPEREIIRLGIGDVTRALPPVCIEAFHRAVDEMASDATFHGYGPEQGYLFLREKIARWDYQERGVMIDPDEIFVSDGAKCDTGNFQELFSRSIRVAIPDPVYPVYVDTNVMAGRTGKYRNGRYGKIIYLDSTPENGFVPRIPEQPVDLVYLCFPNNPTGATATRNQLEQWVAYAHKHRSLILFDAAYESFIRDPDIPHTIFEIPGADEVCVEFRSFSKNAGFTGTRCAFTVVPKKCRAFTKTGEPIMLHKLWFRRQSTKFNGVSYPVQRAAEAVYSEEGRKQTKDLIDYYLGNALRILQTMERLGFFCTGGRNAPYIWVKTDLDSWEFFDIMLEKAGVVCTPGSGFGRCGNKFVRISAFNSRENVEKALKRIEEAFS